MDCVNVASMSINRDQLNIVKGNNWNVFTTYGNIYVGKNWYKQISSNKLKYSVLNTTVS